MTETHVLPTAIKKQFRFIEYKQLKIYLQFDRTQQFLTIVY